MKQYRCAQLDCHHYITEGKYCQKHLPATTISPGVNEEDDSSSVLGTLLAAEVLSEAFSSPEPTVDTSTPDVSTPDPTPDFGGFGGGDSGGGGAGGDF